MIPALKEHQNVGPHEHIDTNYFIIWYLLERKNRTHGVVGRARKNSPLLGVEQGRAGRVKRPDQS